MKVHIKISKLYWAKRKCKTVHAKQ